MNLRQAVVFVILMQNYEGIIGKAPVYLFEKLNACKTMKIPECLLDNKNLKIFNDYAKKWGYNWNKEVDLKIPANAYCVDSVSGEFLGKCDFCGKPMKRCWFNGINMICDECKNKEKGK